MEKPTLWISLADHLTKQVAFWELFRPATDLWTSDTANGQSKSVHIEGTDTQRRNRSVAL